MEENKKNSIAIAVSICFAVIIAVAVILRYGLDYASASYEHDNFSLNNDSAPFYSNHVMGQQIYPQANGMSNWRVYVYQANPITVDTFNYYICGGVADSEHFDTTYNCTATGNTFIASGTETRIATTGNAGYIQASTTATLIPGNPYYIAVKPNNPAGHYWQGSYDGQSNCDTGTADCFSFAVGDGMPLIPSDGYDLYFYEDYNTASSGIPGDYDNPNVAYETILGLDYSFLSLKHDYYCLASSTFPCVIDFRFNSYAEGSQVWFYYSDNVNDGVPTGNKLATTTIVQNNLDQASTTIPYSSQYSGKVVPYCALLYDPEGIDVNRLFCDWSINWLSEQNLDYLIQKNQLHKYNINEACLGMDDSASTTFAYGVQCGLRKFGYWAITPSYESQLSLLDSVSNLKSQFPMSIYYQVKDNMLALSSEIASSSTSTVWHVPLLLYGLNVATSVDLISENTILNSLGSVWINFNQAISYFIYFITFLYFLKEIFRVAERNTHDH